MKGSDLQHHYIANTALPYAPNGSVTSKEPSFIAGQNVLTSLKNYAEKRNGFARQIADAAFTFSGTLSRIYTWRRWTGTAITLSGAYFVMYNDVAGTTTSRIYKQRVGTDVYPILIHTDSTSANKFDFTVSNDFLFFGNGVDMKKYDGTTVTNWGITAPASAVTYTTSTGLITSAIERKWLIAWGNSTTGHISSPSPVSATTTGTLKKYTLSGNTTSDAQVDKVHVFRPIDGGSIFFEHRLSPISYVTWVASGFEDNDTDDLLTTQVAPLPNQNNRPTASFDPIWFATRMWTHFNDTLYYSCFEELVRGVEEESFAQVNSRFFGREIVAKRIAGQFMLIFTADVIYRLYGDSLATFRMDTLGFGRGAQNRAAVCSFGDYVAWLDSANTIWTTDGTSLTEISFPIRSDIAAIVHSTAAMTYHDTGNERWLILMDGTGMKLYVYDLDTQRWMPPWELPL